MCISFKSAKTSILYTLSASTPIIILHRAFMIQKKILYFVINMKCEKVNANLMHNLLQLIAITLHNRQQFMEIGEGRRDFCFA